MNNIKQNQAQQKPEKFVYDDLRIGQEAHFDATITKELVKEFSIVSGDSNPLHVDSGYAATTEFKKPIAHGMIAGALVSRLLGMQLPGLYCLYLSQNLTFKKPIFYGTKVIVKGVVIQKIDACKMARIETSVTDESGTVLVAGEATVQLLK